MVIGWALRWVLLCCGLVLLGVGMLDRGAALLPDRTVRSGSDARPGSSGERATGPPSNTIVYTANQRGHVILDAAVNGAPVADVASLRSAVERVARHAAIVLQVSRGGRLSYVAFERE